ncbi:hypothetical protein ACWA1F_21165 [Flavobacterium sp. 3-218]
MLKNSIYHPTLMVLPFSVLKSCPEFSNNQKNNVLIIAGDINVNPAAL